MENEPGLEMIKTVVGLTVYKMLDFNAVIKRSKIDARNKQNLASLKNWQLRIELSVKQINKAQVTE